MPKKLKKQEKELIIVHKKLPYQAIAVELSKEYKIKGSYR